MIKIGFIGAGAIGSLFGGCLANIKEKKVKLTLFCTTKHANAIKKHGLRIKRDKEIIVVKNIEVYDKSINYSFNNALNFDYLFLSTKTYDIEQAMIQYIEIIKNSKWLIILQNGLGNEDLIKEYVDKKKLMRIITSHGAILSKPGCILHTGKGFTYIGFPYSNNVEKDPTLFQKALADIRELNSILNYAHFDSNIENNILIKTWQKAIVNIGINAIGALTRLNNGKLLEREVLRDLLDQTIKEAVNVAQKMNIVLSYDDCIALAHSVAEKTYNNKNSMLQDVLKGRRTEIDFLNGKIVKLAENLTIKVPVNKILTTLIKGLEN
jgi:2-dehydropantoate 2-reductase